MYLINSYPQSVVNKETVVYISKLMFIRMRSLFSVGGGFHSRSAFLLD